ncbi:ABC transporter permease [Clostridium saccharoperbutylacetonicum]|uniref:ABC transporter permease n=1 Tax=Clostridium saccharoperbutylacetonicum TaxID=36745 RepID=UPI000983A9FD|nr:ABC transporter permease [Clostridium saccharoperbutylacetonicum]AQR97839.1 teichoic acid translocation permease protein TagG [Clostridium saccharoperbutylacetonicum]NSB33731.1 ABC-2 type transport system permease protein [Clostridium saccharoperbutylacetonicum]
MDLIKKIISFNRFRFLLSQLVRRDFKVKYRGSILGVLWSVLNPLLNMIVLSIVFSQVFRQVDNYKMYLLSGLTVFNFYSEATNNAINSIVGNFSLITKVYFPKFILPLSKVISTAINLGISVVVFFILGSFMGIKIWWGIVLIPFMLIFLLLFSAGISFIVSALQVFFRDTQHLYGIFLTIWMYSTPILYPIDIVPTEILPIFKANPLYIFIDFLRQITLNGVVPNITSFIYCVLWGIGTFIVGAFVFVKSQDNFIYYS